MHKYNLNSLIGNGTTIYLLKTSLRKRTFRNFSIFGGNIGTGKSTSAKIVAMGLTCENPSDGQPCCECSTCKANMAAFQSTGEAPLVKVVNLGLKATFDDVQKLIEDVFVLQSSNKNEVYIFEEAHALKSVKGGFTAFLAEIDKMPQNVYVIMCTTELENIPKDIKSRAALFNFPNLNKSESRALVNRMLAERHYRVSPDVVTMIVNASKGSPREIEKLVDLVLDYEITKDELASYLQVVNDDTFISIFQAIKEHNLLEMNMSLTKIFEDVSFGNFKNALIDFMLRVAYLVEGDIVDGFTLSQKSDVISIFDEDMLVKSFNTAKIISKCRETNEVMMQFLDLFLGLQNKDKSSVFLQNGNAAAKDRVQVQMFSLQAPQENARDGKLTSLDLSKMPNFGR